MLFNHQLRATTGGPDLNSDITSEGNEFDRELGIACFIYTICAASEYWLLSWLKFEYDINLPVFFAILQNLSWPIQAVVYYYERKAYEKVVKPRVVTYKMYQSYVILGVLNSVVTLSRTIGLSTLPPTIYTIVANTEIVFEGLLSCFYLKRTLSSLQIASIAFVVIGVIVSLWNPADGTYGEGNNNTTADDMVLGLGVSFLSRLASSLNTILADKFLGKDRKTRLGVLECSFFNALIPCMILPIALAIVPEGDKWTEQLTGRDTKGTVGVTFLCITVCLAKYGDRLSKFTIVSKASTMFFAIIDSNMKLVAGIGTIIFFTTSFTGGQGIGFGLIFISLLLSLYDKKKKMDAEKAEAERKALMPPDIDSEEGKQQAEADKRKSDAYSRDSEGGANRNSESGRSSIIDSALDSGRDSLTALVRVSLKQSKSSNSNGLSRRSKGSNESSGSRTSMEVDASGAKNPMQSSTNK